MATRHVATTRVASEAEDPLLDAYPEARLVGFTRCDATVQLYSQIHSILRPHHKVLEFGAGRGAAISRDRCEYRRRLQILRGRCAELVGCDIDEAVLRNPWLDRGVLLDRSGRVPFNDASFDLVIANSVFEHIEGPEVAANEIVRVLRPGGFLFASTPNALGYVALGCRLLRMYGQVRALRYIQPARRAEDIFPAYYRMNTARALRRLFETNGTLVTYSVASEPSYNFGSTSVVAAMRVLHFLLPAPLRPMLHVIFRKHGD